MTDPAHQAMIGLIETQRDHIRQRYGHDTKYLFPVFHGKRESFLGQNWTQQALKKLCLHHRIVDGEGRPFDFSWHPLRHHRGTQMAAEGHDILSIMFELGHASPDMASLSKGPSSRRSSTVQRTWIWFEPLRWSSTAL